MTELALAEINDLIADAYDTSEQLMGFVAVCVRGQYRQTIDLHDSTLPSSAPAGAKWITAYRRWAAQQ